MSNYPIEKNIKEYESFINNYSIQSEEDYIRRKILRNNDYNGFSNKFNNYNLKLYNNITFNNLDLNYSNEILKIINNYKIKIGFIILRCVNSEKAKHFWINCYNSIRKFYDNPIIIIDDNSNNKYLIDINLVNCKIINSEYPQRGELLPYIYYLSNKFCDRMVFLHDTMSIENKIDFENIKEYNNYTRIFSFSNVSYKRDIDSFEYFCSFLKLGQNIKKYHYKNINNLLGCFGVCSVIDNNFLKKINEKYNITNLLKCILNRDDRKTLERLLICIFEYETFVSKFKTKKSLLGDINTNIYLQKKSEYVLIKKYFLGR